MAKIFSLIALALCACGGMAADNSDGSDAGCGYEVIDHAFGQPSRARAATPEECLLLETEQDASLPQEAVPGPAGDYGQTSEALSVPQGEYGVQKIAGGPCVSQNTQTDYCGVPTDKIIKYHWSGPETDSNFPTLNFKTILQEAVAELASLGTSFTWQNGSSTSNEGMALSNNTCSGGVCSYGETSVFYSLPAKQVSPGFWAAKANACDTRISLNVAIQNGWHTLSASNQHFRFKRLFEHEMGHCAGFPDFYDSGHQGIALMYGFFMTQPPTFSPLEVQIMQMYRP